MSILKGLHVLHNAISILSHLTKTFSEGYIKSTSNAGCNAVYNSLSVCYEYMSPI